jgi:hypothetical protein
MGSTVYLPYLSMMVAAIDQLELRLKHVLLE